MPARTPDPVKLSRRERQIMDAVFTRGEAGASANEVLSQLPDPPTRTSIRTILRILEQKGHVTHQVVGREFVYRPTAPREKVGRSALRSVLRSFFSGSLPKAMAAHFADPDARLSPDEAKELQALIQQARKRGE